MVLLTRKRGYSGHRYLLATLLVAAGALAAADSSNSDDIATLKAQIAEQKKQLEALQTAIANQQKLLERVTANVAPPTATRAAVEPRRSYGV